ncbi:MAG: N-acetylmuramoyl-L-alanine amidase [Thermoanaerobaculia bacterium]|nr:N-acetylmuramoyl-L-alanine amidase [Thermoanaerobaculia bacterium]
MVSSAAVTARIYVATLALLLLLSAGLGGGLSAAGDDRVLLGPAGQQTAVGPLFPLEPIAARLGAKVDKSLDSYTITVGDFRVIAGPGNPVMLLGRDIVQLSQAPVVDVGAATLLVPMDLLQKSLGDALAFDFTYGPEAGLIAERRRLRTVPVTVDVVHLQGVTTVVLQFTEPVQLRRVATGEGVDVTPVRDRFEAAGQPFVGDDPWVRDVRVSPERIRLLLASGAKAESYSLENPFRLVFDVVAASGAAPGETPTGEAAAGPVTGPSRPTPAFDTIVLDPGHGGTETGAIGPAGTQEKEITLAIAQTLAAQLRETLGVKVVLTREQDQLVPLDARPGLANQNKADLFVSIHLNSWFDQDAHGAETYFLSLEASDRRANASAEVENRAPAGSGDGDPLADLELILWDLAQTRHLHSSEKVAKIVQAELNQALGLTDRGVKQAPFRVLMGAAMPAVLVELGYVSNPDEEAKLRDPAYREQLASALVRAIAAYASDGRAPAAPAEAAPPAAPTAESPP